MCSVVPALAQIFGLIQMQSKSNPSAQKGIPHNPIIPKSSYVQCNTNKSLRSTLAICSFWSTLVPSVYFSPFGPFSPLWSIALSLVHFGPLLHFHPLGPIQSIQSFCSIRSTLVSQVQSIRSFWSTSVYQLHYVESGPLRSNSNHLLENSVLLVQFSPFCPLQSIVPKQTLSYLKHA